MDADFCARADGKLHGSSSSYFDQQSDVRTVTLHGRGTREGGDTLNLTKNQSSQCETSVNQLNEQQVIISHRGVTITTTPAAYTTANTTTYTTDAAAAAANKRLSTTCLEVSNESIDGKSEREVAAGFCHICHQKLTEHFYQDHDILNKQRAQDCRIITQAQIYHDQQIESDLSQGSRPICSHYLDCSVAVRRRRRSSSNSISSIIEKVASSTKLDRDGANNQIDDSDNNSIHSNSFLFWKILSNLSKSINHRKSNCSNTLAPEVAGYLASKQQCSSGNSRENAMNFINPTTGRQVPNHEHTETSDESTLSRVRSMMMEPLSSLSDQNREIAAADQITGGGTRCAVVSRDGHRLIQIVPPQSKDIDDSQCNTTDYQNQHEQSSAATGTLAQVKLSIATTTRTTRSSVSSVSSCILSDSTSTSEVRLKWGKKMDFLLSIIGFAVDLANIWRFPYLVYKNGGGVFLIPYITMLIFGGIPLFFLELCLGQYVKKGPITVWNKICPSMKGVGYCSILISWYVSFYYNVLIAWSVYFIYRSLLSVGDKMPWEECDNSWNSKVNCVSISQLKNLCSTRNETLEMCRKDLFANVNVTSPASEFFVKELSQIDQSTGLEDMGYLRMELVVCLMIVYLLHYFSLFRGLETSGKVVWVTATAPYMILSILLVRGLFLPGASMGIEYYLSPRLEKLADPQVWIDAAGQVFYSIGVGFGVHLTYASFNSHNNNCYRDCLMTSAVNAATSVYSGLVVFVYLGYMAKNLGIEIDKVASEGYSLVFEVYPEALTTLPFARFWSILFFIMLLTLGIDSAMGGLEAVITGLEDEFKFAKRLSRGQLTGLVIVSSFLPALISCTQGGAYTLFWFDIYSAGVSLLFSALFETIGVVYCYGLNKFIPNIESMLGRKPHLFYIVCWKYISPIFLGGVIFMSLYTASVPTYRGYTFPLWSIILGWCLAFSSVAAVPIVALWHWFHKRGKPVRRSASATPDKSIRKCDQRTSSSRVDTAAFTAVGGAAAGAAIVVCM